MKRSLIIFFLVLSFILGAEPVKVTLRPASPAVGDRVSVIISTSLAEVDAMDVVLPPLGELARWNYNVRSVRTMMRINTGGRREITTEFIRQFTALKPGKLEIPPIRLEVDGKSFRTRPFTVEISAAPVKSAADEPPRPFGRFRTLPERSLRPGEKVELHMDIYVPLQYNLMNINSFHLDGMDGAVLLAEPRTRQKLQILHSYRETVNSVDCVVYPVRGTVRVTQSGKFYPQARFLLTVRERRQIDNSGFDDDIFDSFFGPRVSFSQPRQISLVLKDDRGVEVVPPPPVPAGFQDLGISGDWMVECKLNTPSCRSGEIAELEIKLTPLVSSLSLNDPMLKIPELKLENFRIYPPDVTRKNGSISIRYALIPLSPGEKKIKLQLALFEPSAGKYRTFTFDQLLAVTPGNVNVKTPAPAASPRTESAAPAVEPASDGLCYLKKVTPDGVTLPLFRNQQVLIFTLLIAGILLLAVDFLCRRWGKFFDPAKFRRRRELKRQISLLIAEIKSSGNPDEVFRKHGFAAVAELLELPPGATAQDVADALDDPELRELFSNMALSGFAPGGVSGKVSHDRVKKLLKFLKNLSVITIFFAAVSIIAGGDSGSDEIRAYDSGEYARVSEICRRKIKSDALSFPVLYNLGCAEYRMGNYPEALLWFSRVQLLSPRDPECRANLKLVEDKLQIPVEEKRSFSGRLAAFRDSLFRPDQYLAGAAWGFFLLCVICVLRGRGGRLLRWSAAALILFISVIFVVAALEQCDSSYSADRLIVTGKSVEIRSLPAENSGNVISTVNGGEYASVLEARHGWLRISCGKYEGWIKSDQAKRIFPYGVF